MKFKKVKQRGQVLVFYALMIPILLLFAGVGLDLGWVLSERVTTSTRGGRGGFGRRTQIE